MRGVFGKEKILIVQALVFIVVFVASFIHTATAQALLQIGAQAPDFSLKDIEGKDISLSQYAQKKAVVVLFWSTWSAKSPNALKRFEDFYKKYKDRGIQVIAINADNQTISNEDMEKIKNLGKELDITFPMLLDKALKTFHEYSVIALPSTIIVSEGKITYELPGLPLVGTEDMFDYLLVLAGEQLKKKMEPKYKPRHDAIADTNLARGFVKKKRYEMAYPLFKKAIEKDPKYMLPYVELAKLYELDGKRTEAEEAFRKALAIESENVVVMSELGYFLTKTGRTKEAVEILEKAVKVNSYTPAHYYYAYALAKNGQMERALNAFDSALSLNPYDPLIYSLRGEVYENGKMLKESASDYKKALGLILKIKE
ncbi:MAG: redoxin domain-containing protein [Nitrospirae bacterium]|jgi:Tfp pilus assembly protein PilF/peroxiredoxin|nr:redoxin domain-containing protein [Nitrospirota bacterium]MDA8215458.1 redoxin domain-containing protein [Nitrospiraceae bacterium]